MKLIGNDPFTQASFSFGNRIYRAIWVIAWNTLFRFSPIPCHAWRNMLLRIFGAKIGRNVHVYASVKVWAPWNLEISDRCGVGPNATLYNISKIIIGPNSVISQGAHLCTGSHDIESLNFQLISSPISVGSNVWVCAEAFIGPGVEIPDGCVVAARAAIFKTIDDHWTVWSGNPAKFLRHRARPS